MLRPSPELIRHRTGYDALAPTLATSMSSLSACEDDAVTVAEAVSIATSGGVIAYPTEAVYGLGCDPRQQKAVERIVRLKQRDAAKGLILIASNQDQLAPWVATLTADEQQRVDAHWPGPVTFVVRAAADVSEWITGGRQTIAVRVSAHPVVRALCEGCRSPLVSTSANVSGKAALLDAAAINDTFGHRIDAIVAGALGSLTSATPIVDVRTGERLR